MRKTDIPGDIVVALVLLTRLPLPRLPDEAFARQARAGWAFPLAGLAVSALACALAAGALAVGLPAAAAAGLLLGAQIAMTGAMHEDGLADSADGLWGGYTVTRRLEIMKDSQIGTYGVLALILFTGLRWLCLTALLDQRAFAAIIAAAVLSRACLPAVMTGLPPARSDGLARRVGVPGLTGSAVAVGLAVVIALALSGPPALLSATVAGAGALAVAGLARAKIGGQTGDILGAVQVVSETAMLLTWLSLV